MNIDIFVNFCYFLGILGCIELSIILIDQKIVYNFIKYLLDMNDDKIFIFNVF